MGHYACDMRPKEIVMEKTDWFPKDVDPAHVGWYERKYEAVDSFPEEIYMDWWSGTAWFMEYCKGKCYSPSSTRRPWRGLIQDHADPLRQLANDILDGALS